MVGQFFVAKLELKDDFWKFSRIKIKFFNINFMYIKMQNQMIFE